jgi:hypothetical protein
MTVAQHGAALRRRTQCWVREGTTEFFSASKRGPQNARIWRSGVEFHTVPVQYGFPLGAEISLSVMFLRA